MNKGQTKTRTARTMSGKRVARERHVAYVARTGNRQHLLQKPRTKKLIVEMQEGEPYAYYPLGKYIVAAPGVCGGRPTFKYTRIEAGFVLDLIRAGWTIADLVDEYAQSNVTAAAIREAMLLAKNSLVRTLSVPNFVA